MNKFILDYFKFLKNCSKELWDSIGKILIITIAGSILITTTCISNINNLLKIIIILVLFIITITLAIYIEFKDDF